MTHTNSSTSPSKPSMVKHYKKHFVKQVHQLLFMGYCEISAMPLSSAEEPEITGHLVAGIRKAMAQPKAPNWAARYFVADDPPINTAEAEGKRRPRVDIEFERGQPGLRPRFQFEAKRLIHISGGCTGKYLGSDGLGAFTSGYYCRDQVYAGMLGYVQSSTMADWISKIKKTIEISPGTFSISGAFSWEKHDVEDVDSYKTLHQRAGMPDIEVYHTFLLFS